MRMAIAAALLTAGLALQPMPAVAKVAQVASAGFVVRHIVQVTASPEEAWAVLTRPSVWWDAEHTWSGEAANLSLDARAGGCFCEILPAKSGDKAGGRGSVEHLRVIYAEPGRALRMMGALGPLQSEALTGTLTFQLKPDPSGTSTQILLEYVVGGYARTAFNQLAPAVDGVLANQMKRLAQKLGGSFAEAFSGIDTGIDAGKAAENVEPTEEEAPGLNTAVPPGLLPLSESPAPPTGAPIGR
ncbi:SRPBCC family protein [Novosphingobium panipatense]|nr:SRPBCC family protein [Novosphingobium panipatense]